jgi:hypothetical protein
VKYDAFGPKKTNAKRVKIIAVLSLFSSIGVGYYFSTAANHPNCFRGVLGLTLLYTLPFFLIEGMRVTGLGSRFISWLCVGGVTGITCC